MIPRIALGAVLTCAAFAANAQDSAVARGLRREFVALARKRITQSGFRTAQPMFQRSAAFWLVRYFGSALHSEGLLSGEIEPLERMPALP